MPSRARSQPRLSQPEPPLAGRVRAFFSSRHLTVEEKRMMGGICFMVNGKMCVGVEPHRLMARIGPEAEPEALRQPGCTRMDMTGRPMRGFVFVTTAVLETGQALECWLMRALAYNETAPLRARGPKRPALRKKNSTAPS